MRVDSSITIFFQNCVRLACYLLVAVFVVMMIASQTMPSASSFAISAKTEYFEGFVDGDGIIFSARNARICANSAASNDSRCGSNLSEIAPNFTGRISLPSDIRLRIRRGDGLLNQLYLDAPGEGDARLRMLPDDGGPIVYGPLPVRIDLPSTSTGAPTMINIVGHSAIIGAGSTRDTSGLRNVLRNGEVTIYGIGLWWHLTGDPTAPIEPSNLFKVGAETLQLGDSISLSSVGHPSDKPVEFWANVSFDPDGVIEISLRAVGDAAVIDRFGGSGLLLRKSWLDTLLKDPLFQVLWSIFGTMIALAGIQFLSRNSRS